MESARQLRRKAEKEKKKPVLKNGPVSELPPSQQMLLSNIKPGSKMFTGGNGAMQLSQEGDRTSVSIDTSKLRPPEKQYVADSFTIDTFIGHSDLYFGKKSPRDRNGDLLNCIAVRFSNKLLKDLVLKGHKDFYDPLLKEFPVSSDHRKQFGIVLEEQFPISQDSQHFVFANFLYAAHSADVGELMFYGISPAYIHHMLSGKPAVFAPDSNGVDGIITMIVPIDLLSYIYQIIIETKNEFR